MKILWKIFLILILLSSNSFCLSKELKFSPEAKSNCDAIYYNKIGIDYYVNKNFEKAVTYFKKAVELDPNYPQAQNNLANVLYKQGKYTQAIQLLENLIAKNPGYTDSYINLALIYRKNEDSDMELQYLNLAINNNSDSYKAYLQRGITFIRLNNCEKAKEDFVTALEINPKSSEAFKNLGQIFLKQCEYDKSLKFFKKSIENQEKDGGIYFANFVENNSNRIIYHYYYCKYLQSIKDYQKASVEFEKIIKAQPTQLEDYTDLAFIYSDQKIYDYLYKILKEGLKKYPGNAYLTNQLADYYELCGNEAKSQKIRDKK